MKRISREKKNNDYGSVTTCAFGKLKNVHLKAPVAQPRGLLSFLFNTSQGDRSWKGHGINLMDVK